MQTATFSLYRARTWRANLLKLFLGVFLILAAAYPAAGAYIANAMTVPRRDFSPDVMPTRPAEPYDSIAFPARSDSVSIAGWYLPNAGASRAVILVHGKDANRGQEWYGRFTEFASSLRLDGYAVLMLDVRGHGASGDGRYSFGLLERRDVLGAVDWLKERKFAPGRIGVLGVSLGGAAAIGATAEDKSLGAVAVDSTFGEFCGVLDKNWESSTGLPIFMKPAALVMTRALYGYDLCTAKPAAEIGSIAPRGVLIMYSTSDSMIPPSQAALLAAAAPNAEIWQTSGADHAQLYREDPFAYREKVRDFFGRYLE